VSADNSNLFLGLIEQGNQRGQSLEKTDPEIAYENINFLCLTECHNEIIRNGKLAFLGRKRLKSPLERVDVDGRVFQA
jgi:hypothetical protein